MILLRNAPDAFPPSLSGCPPKNTTNIRRIERGLVVMGCVLDVVRVLYSMPSKKAPKGISRFHHLALAGKENAPASVQGKGKFKDKILVGASFRQRY